MRILLAFVTAIAAIIATSSVTEGDWAMVAGAGAVALVAGAFLWRNLKDPAKTRAMGLQASVTFLMADTRDEVAHGTLAQVKTILAPKQVWHLRLDRHPEGGDMALIDTSQRGWVWLGPDNLPLKVKIDYGASWKTWDVLSARPSTPVDS